MKERQGKKRKEKKRRVERIKTTTTEIIEGRREKNREGGAERKGEKREK